MRPVAGHRTLLSKARALKALSQSGSSRPFTYTSRARNEQTSAPPSHDTLPAYKLTRPPRLRFAPSPTGHLHLGGLRTALFNHLFARRYGGQWLLRIEDTDQSRVVSGAVESLQETLAWAGLEYDEGPSVGGSKGPYVQSERLPLYRNHAERLISLGKAYRDFRPPAEDKGKGKRGRGVRIVDDYVPPDEDEARQLIRDGKSYVVRLKSEAVQATFTDLVFGEITFQPDIGSTDPILLKSDGWPTYHLANVVDDHEMGITHVLRGEEWLPSVPKHLDIYAALGFEVPTFVHLPLLINKGGGKLSKRDGDVHVTAYRDAGYEPEALVNFVALMGYNHRIGKSGEQFQKLAEDEAVDEYKTMEQLIEEFDPLRISPSRAALFAPKLAFLNQRHVAQKSPTEIHDRLRPRFHELYNQDAKSAPLVKDNQYVNAVIALLRSRVKVLSDLPGEAWYFFEDPEWTVKAGEEGQDSSRSKRKQAGPYEHEKFGDVLREVSDSLSSLPEGEFASEQTVQDLLESAAAKVSADADSSDAGKQVRKMLRFVLCKGRPGPPVESIIATLGKDTTSRRVSKVLQMHREGFDFKRTS